MSQSVKRKSQADKRLFILSLVVFLGTCLLVFSVLSSRGRSTIAYATATPAQIMTLEPAIVANMTSVASVVLTGDLVIQLNDVEQMLAACPDYIPERRSQMEQHIEWLRNPAQIPPDLLPAFGAEPAGRLIFGMATYTSIQWGLLDRLPTSCLLPIGRLLNEMLVAVGETPVEDFEE